MKSISFLGIVIGTAAGLTLLAGCGSDEQHPHDGDHADHVHGALAPAADSAAAAVVAVCPVSGEELGSMGDPHVVSYEGKQVKLCCDGCEEDFLKEPQKFLSKLMQDAAKPR